MPFTPFHLGFGTLAKSALDQRLSVTSFALAQVAMDIEPGIGMLRGSAELHGWSHTLGGALLVGIAVAAIPLRVWDVVSRRWNAEVTWFRMPWLTVDEPSRRAAIATGALVGTISHILLDALIHADMSPFAPFATGNPLLGLVEHDTVYRVCLMGLGIGSLAWTLRRWRMRQRATHQH